MQRQHGLHASREDCLGRTGRHAISRQSAGPVVLQAADRLACCAAAQYKLTFASAMVQEALLHAARQGAPAAVRFGVRRRSLCARDRNRSVWPISLVVGSAASLLQWRFCTGGGGAGGGTSSLDNLMDAVPFGPRPKVIPQSHSFPASQVHLLLPRPRTPRLGSRGDDQYAVAGRVKSRTAPKEHGGSPALSASSLCG